MTRESARWRWASPPCRLTPQRLPLAPRPNSKPRKSPSTLPDLVPLPPNFFQPLSLAPKKASKEAPQDAADAVSVCSFNRYIARLNRVNREAEETLALWGGEFEFQPEELGFVDPASFGDVGFEVEGALRPGTGGGGSDGGVEDTEDGDAAPVIVGDGDDALLVGGEGAEAGEVDKDAAAVANDSANGVPVPCPMNIEEPDWDAQGDCVPLPAWKVCASFALAKPKPGHIPVASRLVLTGSFVLGLSVENVHSKKRKSYVGKMATISSPWDSLGRGRVLSTCGCGRSQ